MPNAGPDFSVSPEMVRALGAREEAGTAKYAALTERLRTMILAGDLAAGARLPNERDLAAMTGLSLGTVQRALRTLVDEGYVVRKPKLGSFVAARTHIRQPWHCRFLADDGKTVLPVEPTTRLRRVIRDTGPWTEHLGPVLGGYLHIERNFAVAGEFDVISRFWGEATRLSALAGGPLSSLDGENLKHLIASKCHLPVTRVVHRVRQGREDASDGLTLIAATWSHGGPLYYQEFSIPPNRREMLVSDEEA